MPVLSRTPPPGTGTQPAADLEDTAGTDRRAVRGSAAPQGTPFCLQTALQEPERGRALLPQRQPATTGGSAAGTACTVGPALAQVGGWWAGQMWLGRGARPGGAQAPPREGPPLAGRPQMLRLDQEPRKTQRFGLPRISGLGNKLPVRHKSHRQRSSESDRERSRSLKQSSRKSSMECEQESWAERGCA